MSAYRAVLLALFVVGGALVAAVPAGATLDAMSDRPSLRDLDAAAATGVTDAGFAVTANETANNSSLGADISSFMQSSAAEVGGAVESGMWTAAFDATENRSKRVDLVERRTSDLEEQLAELRQRKAELLDEREAGNLSETAYKAKVSRLIGRINALESSINATATRAKTVNADVDRLETLRTETENLSGPEIAAVARNVTGVGNGQGGPPDHAGAGNGASGNDEESTGPPDHANSANETTNASRSVVRPDDAGEAAVASNASGNAAGTGPANATGNGTGNATGNVSDALGNADGAGNEGGNGVRSAAANATGNGATGTSGNGNVPVDGSAVDERNASQPSSPLALAGGTDVEPSSTAPTTAGLLGHVSDALGAHAFSLGRALAGT